jgi:hypothetical protein
MIEEHKLPTYELANGAICFYFTKGLAENDKVFFKGVDGETTFRQLVGYKSMRASDGLVGSKRFWHFGIQAKPLIYPIFAYIIKPHVLFSDDGSKIWDSKARLHKARRSQCKNWWNPDWRDRILAVMNWLANGENRIDIQLGSDVAIQVSNYPITFTSPISYIDPEISISSVGEDEEEEEYDDELYEMENGVEE